LQPVATGRSRFESEESHVLLAFAPVTSGAKSLLRYMRRLGVVAIGDRTLALSARCAGAGCLAA
jgi:hypothetical protein